MIRRIALAAACCMAGTVLAQSPAATPDDRSSPFAEAADRMLARECDQAIRLLEPLAESTAEGAVRARLLLGFYAHACERPGTAMRWLSSRPSEPGRFEDWRLFLLSDVAASRRDTSTALIALTRLLADHPGSVLRQRAIARAAHLAWEEHDGDRALYLIRLGRYEEIEGEAGEELERLAWQIGTMTGDLVARQEAARRLLSHWPLAAAELKVIELFRAPSGELDWPQILSSEALMIRARVLLEASLESSALETLEEVSPADRTLEWRLLNAEALLRTDRPEPARAILGTEVPDEPRRAVEFLWWRSRVERALSRAGRPGALSPSERRAMERRADETLRQIIRLDARRELTVAALEELFRRHVEEDSFEGAMQTLAHLRRLEPQDTSGDRYLWELGWREYEASNTSGSIGYWRELIELYPESVYARAGLYWSARAHARLENRDRANQLFRQVVEAPGDDFYRRHALAQLGRPQTPAPSPDGPLPMAAWPRSDTLNRAHALLEMGLPNLAISEAEAASTAADRRAVLGLEARAHAAAGEPRDSIHRLIEVFPDLGRPARQHLVPVDARRLYYPLAYQELVWRYARLHGVDPLLILGMIRQESAFDANAVSYAGARGLMQLMPATSRELAARFDLPWSLGQLSDPEYSIRLGIAYFGRVRAMFDGNEELALAGYNGGPYRIRRLWRAAGPGAELDRFLEGLRPDQTRIYVKRIVAHRGGYAKLYPELDRVVG